MELCRLPAAKRKAAFMDEKSSSEIKVTIWSVDPGSTFDFGIYMSLYIVIKLNNQLINPKTKYIHCDRRRDVIYICLRLQEAESKNMEPIINELPDDVLRHIVSFLPLKDAVETSMVSHRWNRLCKHLIRTRRNLEFDAYKGGSTGEIPC